MGKKLCDTIGIILLAIGVITLPLLKGRDEQYNLILAAAVCGITVFLILLIKIIGYKTGYSEAEKKGDKINFVVLLLLLISLLFIGGVLFLKNNS